MLLWYYTCPFLCVEFEWHKRQIFILCIYYIILIKVVCICIPYTDRLTKHVPGEGCGFCCRGNKPWEVECAFAFEQQPNFVCMMFKCCIGVFLFSGWSAQWPNSDSVLQGLQPRCTGPGDCQRRGGADDAVWGLPASHWHLSSVGTLSFLLLFHSCLVQRIWVHVMISVSTVVFTVTTHLAGWLAGAKMLQLSDTL